MKKKTKRGAKIRCEEKAMVAVHSSVSLHGPAPAFEIGIGNQLVDMLQDIINEHLENMTRTEERMQASIPV